MEHEQEVPRLRGALAKVMYETNMKEDIERAMGKGDDTNYLESQVLGDQEAGADMEAIQALDDYEYMDFEYMDKQDEESEEEEQVSDSLAKPKAEKIHLGFVDPSDYDSEEYENSESI